ncbi:MAG: ADP-heptose--LPS heptosyltransferase, partial [Pseudomonadota bacterium]
MIQPTILVIKHGGLGDFIQALDAFWWLRNHHQHARLVLLTSPSLQPFASTVPWFDACLYDRRSWSSLISIPALIRKLRPHRIYDLQTSNRTATYLRLLQSAGWRGEWSGHARGASHRHDDPNRDHIHTRERLQAQLRIAGVPMLGEA